MLHRIVLTSDLVQAPSCFIGQEACQLHFHKHISWQRTISELFSIRRQSDVVKSKQLVQYEVPNAELIRSGKVRSIS